MPGKLLKDFPDKLFDILSVFKHHETELFECWVEMNTAHTFAAFVLIGGLLGGSLQAMENPEHAAAEGQAACGGAAAAAPAPVANTEEIAAADGAAPPIRVVDPAHVIQANGDVAYLLTLQEKRRKEEAAATGANADAGAAATKHANDLPLILQASNIAHEPRNFFKLTTVSRINFSHCLFQDLSPGWGVFTNLGVLNLGHNQLTKLPVEIGQLTTLIDLYLGHNDLTDLPDLSALVHLYRLYLPNNAFPKVPPTVRDLKALHVLNLANNTHITHIPSWLGGELPALSAATFSGCAALTVIDACYACAQYPPELTIDAVGTNVRVVLTQVPTPRRTCIQFTEGCITRAEALPPAGYAIEQCEPTYLSCAASRWTLSGYLLLGLAPQAIPAAQEGVYMFMAGDTFPEGLEHLLPDGDMQPIKEPDAIHRQMLQDRRLGPLLYRAEPMAKPVRPVRPVRTAAQADVEESEGGPAQSAGACAHSPLDHTT